MNDQEFRESAERRRLDEVEDLLAGELDEQTANRVRREMNDPATLTGWLAKNARERSEEMLTRNAEAQRLEHLFADESLMGQLKLRIHLLRSDVRQAMARWWSKRRSR